MSSQNHAEWSKTINNDKFKSTVINSSTAVINGKRNEPTIWPSSDEDDDENLIADQLQVIEACLNDVKPNSVDTKSCASPNLVKRKQLTIIADDTRPLQSSSSHGPVETKEKRHRSLLDCLDQNYFSESPNKIKRESIRCDIGSISAINPSKSSTKLTEECCIDIDDVSTNKSTESNDNIENLHINEETNETIQKQTDKLETLRVGVVSDNGSDTPSNVDSSSPEVIPGTPPASELSDGKIKTQRTLREFFRTK